MQNVLIQLILSLTLAGAVSGATTPVEAPQACQQCRMDRTTFAHSRMLLEYADNTVVGLCSLHCAAVEMMQHRSKQVRTIKVADYFTKNLIDARTASWVIGGDRKGVMTFVPKWAFTRAEEAQAFLQDYGGEVTSFTAALQAANAEVATDATTH